MDKNKKNILIVDDYIETSKYKKWLEDEANDIDGNFNITLINDPTMAEQILNLKTMILFLLVLECP